MRKKEILGWSGIRKSLLPVREKARMRGMLEVFQSSLLFISVLSIFIFCLACSNTPSEWDADGGWTQNSIFVVTTDYMTGSCSIMDMTTQNVSKNVCQISSDAISRYHDGKMYVVNRLGQDNIQILDPKNGFATINQFSVEAGSNAQDIAFANGKLYVTRMEKNTVWVMNPSGDKLGEIDLSVFAGPDGYTDPGMMAFDGRYIYVSIMRLDKKNNYAPTDKSYVAIIDPRTDTLVGDGILLNTVNPWPGVVFSDNKIYVGTSGEFGKSNGAFEVIDPVTLTDTGIVVSSAALGGDIIPYFTVYKGVIYAVISDANFNTSLLSYDTATSEKMILLTTQGYNLASPAVSIDGTELIVSDRDIYHPGLRIFDIKTGIEKTASAIDTGLPPYFIVTPNNY